MDTVLAECDFKVAYLVDILIKSVSKEQHIEHVKRVFEKYKNTGSNSLRKSANCFCLKSRTLTKMIINQVHRGASGIKNMPPPPANVTRLQAFL